MGVAPYKQIIHGDWVSLERIINDLYRILNADTTLLDLATPPGSDGEIIYNDGGTAYGADSTFTLNDSTKMVTVQDLSITSVAASVVDTDKFLVDDSNVVKFRTGAEVLSDIGGSPSGHLHDGATLEHDGVNSDGGAFAFSTTGDVTFNQGLIAPGITITGSAVLGLNSAVFQPAAGGDSATFFQIKNAAGTPFITGDSTNGGLGIGGTSAIYKLFVKESGAVDLFANIENLRHDKRAIFLVSSNVAKFDMRAHGSSWSETRFGQALASTSMIAGIQGPLLFGTLNNFDVIFGTNDLGRIIIKDAGNVGIHEPDAETLLELTHATPIIQQQVSTHTNALDARKSIWRAKGNKTDETEHTLGQFSFSHDGTGDDFLAKYVLSLNQDAGADTLSDALTIDSNLLATFGGNIVIPDTGYIGSVSDPSAIQIAANGEVTFSDVATGILPITGDNLATKEYVDLAIGSELDFFLSDTDDAVVANTHVMFERETGEAESTEVSGSLSQGDDQLIFSWLSEIGRPAASHAREGVYDLHIHLHKTGTKPVNIYWTLSQIDADGSSNETLIVTSEITAALTVSELTYDIHAVVPLDITTGVAKRLITRVYADVGATGSNVTVTATMEGTTDSHLTVDVPSDVWQLRGDVLDDLNILGAVASDGQIIVGTGAGVFAYESGATARASLGLTIGTHVQAWDASLDSIAALTYVSDSFIKVTAEDTYAIRTIAETKTDLSLNLVENTALSTWVGSANITTLGTIGTGTWEATDVGIAHGGTGQSTAQLAINALSAVGAATNEHVLTKDTGTGNAIWKVTGGGVAAHAILDGTVHTDSVADGVTRGSLIYGNATPKWDELVIGAADTFLGSDSTDASWRTAAQVLASLSGEAGAAFSWNSQDLTSVGDITAGHLGLGGEAVDSRYVIDSDETMTITDNSSRASIYTQLQVAKTSAVFTDTAWGLFNWVALDSTNTQNWTNFLGLRGVGAFVQTEGSSSGTITGTTSFYGFSTFANAATVTNHYGCYLATPTVAGGKLINEYGLYIADQNTGATLNYSIYTGLGIVRLGGSLQVPNMLSGANQGAAGAAAGELWHDTTDDTVKMGV